MQAPRPYPAYKDSGVEWLGQVPAHWEVRPVRHVAEVINGYPFDSARFSDSCGHPLIRIRDLDRNRTTTRYDGPFVESARIEPGALLVGMDGDFNVGRWLGEAPALLNQRMCRIRANDEVTETFLYYSLARPLKELNDVAWSTTVKHLKSSQVERLRFAWPPLPEQAAIARFLDHATSRIDRYIRSRQKLIALLEEQKQALIHEAVTGRIDVRTGKPYPAYKDSGVEWLGQVPEHWERRRLRTILQPVDRRSVDGCQTLLSLRRDHGVVPYSEHFSRPPQASSLIGFKVVEVGQLVVNRLQANNGLVFSSSLNGLVSPDYSVFSAKLPLRMRFLSDLLRTSELRTHFRRESTGLGTGTAGFLRLYDNKLLATPVALPTLPEQSRIVAYGERLNIDIGETRKRIMNQLECLGEYHTRLIADVVTGKLDVREAAAALPDAGPSDMSSTRPGCESLIGGK